MFTAMKKAALVTLGLAAALATGIWAQSGGGPEGGGGRPGGSAFSTQYKSGTGFGGTGPGTSGFVLTSNGAAAAPTFQAAASGLPSSVQGDMFYASGTNTVTTLNKSSSANRVILSNGTSNNPVWGQIDISGSIVGSSILGSGNGGTGVGSALDDRVLVGNGSSWTPSVLTSCSAATSAVTYNTSTNSFGCNTISGGVAQTTGTFTISWDDGCTTTPTSPVSWTLTGTVVTWVIGPMSPTTCTSDSTNMRATSTSTIPMALRPTANQYVTGVYMKDGGGASATGCIGFATTGIVDAVPNDNSGCPGPSWTNTGANKSVGFDKTTTVVYQLN